jgi:PhnB protein
MAVVLAPYLSFRSDAEEAMEFYRSILGGEVTSSRYGEFHMGGPDESDKIMHSQLVTPGGLILMAADTPDSLDFTPGTNFSVSLSGEDLDELRGYFEGLSEGGTVTAPFEASPWGAVFGMVTDRYQIHWMVNADPSGTGG